MLENNEKIKQQNKRGKNFQVFFAWPVQNIQLPDIPLKREAAPKKYS